VAAVRRGGPVPVPASISGSKPVLTPPRPARRSGSPVTTGPATHPPHVVAQPGHDVGAEPGVPAPRRPPLGPSTPPAPIVPLELPPAPRSGRGLLVAVFVLLTLAALALGVFILRGGVNLGELTLGRTETGSVTGWESLLAGWVVLIRPLTSRTAKGATR
jgi:eukaryotic-like serine/threonine-protein kinase